MTDDLLNRLAAPFPPAAISWRIGSTNQDKTKGMALAYIDARDVQDRLHDACGIFWQVRHPWSSGSLIACEIGILVDSVWIWRGDGAGESDVDDGLSGPRKEQQQDMVRKAAFSDSFKRAAVRWGIGRYLYEIPTQWVALEQRGRSYVIAESEFLRLRGGLSKPKPTSRPTANGGARTAAPRPAERPEHAAAASGEGARPKWIAEFLARQNYEIDPTKAGGWSAWEKAYVSIADNADNIEQTLKLERDNAAHFSGFRENVRQEVYESFRSRIEANEKRLWVKPDAASLAV